MAQSRLNLKQSALLLTALAALTSCSQVEFIPAKTRLGCEPTRVASLEWAHSPIT